MLLLLLLLGAGWGRAPVAADDVPADSRGRNASGGPLPSLYVMEPPPAPDEEDAASPCPYGVEALDFLHNLSDARLLEEEWPCEVRVYWAEQLRPLVAIVRSLLSYCAPFMVVLGLTVNSMAFTVLSTSALSGSSLSVYLRALAVTDNCALVFNVAVSFARAHLDSLAKLFLAHEWLCALNKVLLGMSFYYSTWLVVSLTWERLATITYPLTLGVWCSKKVALMVVCTLGVLFFMVGVIRVKYSGFEQDSVFEFEPCKVHTALHMTLAMYGYLVLSLWLPLVLIVVGNLCLVATLRRSARTRSELTAKKDRDTLRLTRMLLMVSVGYVVLLLPLGIVATLELFWNTSVKRDSLQRGSTLYSHWLKGKLLLKWVRGACYFIYLFNFCINFFLYCMSGRKFRRAATQHFQRRLSQPLSRLYKSSPSSSSEQADSPRKASNPALAHVNEAFLADEVPAVEAGCGRPAASVEPENRCPSSPTADEGHQPTSSATPS
ncbi:CX3C chemokine receptor 1-like [Bacillus rossius redtenbacheri]|uniref:CX3C chemokine receptor 1-like n=1 Tax=Bacillus rossius redtenbacheri TaxID=93214 RepID=UPI002FDEC2FA